MVLTIFNCYFVFYIILHYFVIYIYYLLLFWLQLFCQIFLLFVVLQNSEKI